ncbi:MAG: amidohydrolase family protein [Candidatus Methanomethylicia archaeon]|nr:amidohydrolase family protein [Candidatus Methanomethylicia archaeon]
MTKYDLVLKGGFVVDPKNNLENYMDIAISRGKIVELSEVIDPRSANEVIDISDAIVFPGVIDTHTHIGRFGHKMMAKVGVTTAIDMSASMDTLISNLKIYGAGLNVATVTNIRHYYPMSDVDLSDFEIEKAIERALMEGALGIKITGGHNPFTPKTTAKIIDACNRVKCYIAFHVGTTNTGSDLNGFLEALDLAGDNGLHIAHVNSYCRGLIEDPIYEALKAISALKGRKRIASESYLALINGTSGKCVNGIPVSRVTRNCLRMKGYLETFNGLKKAIMDGYCHVRIEAGGECVLVTGEEGVKYWLEAGTDIGVSFPVNDPEAQIILATAKDGGKFVVDAISTDGGDIPRNVQVEYGMLLVKFGALSLRDLAVKLSLNPALMFGFENKGHLGVGADADITVIDPITGRAYMGISNGKIIMINNVVVGSGGRIITTKHGVENVKGSGVEYTIVDLSKAKIYSGEIYGG